MLSGEARGRYLASERHGFSGQVAQLVEHTTENRGVGGSIPPLATCVFSRIGAGIAHHAKVRSSTGRAPVSKTGGWGFESLRACTKLQRLMLLNGNRVRLGPIHGTEAPEARHRPKGPYRLTARTPLFQGGNRGSIPRGGVGREGCAQCEGSGAVAQLVRVPVCHTGGRGFESRQPRWVF